ncbi:CHAP domain-containing protein [Streptococcus suis]|nr:CHAP domain-containing protein [Streptococcus suis]
MKKAIIVVGSLFLLGYMVIVAFTSLLISSVSGESSSCEVSPQPVSVEMDASNASIDDFVKQHEEAYILSWKAGGFLPSASITQTMIENGFNFSNPNGTSLWQAHNMGGVKTSSLSNFPVTLATYGQDSVDLSGTKPGASVGDGTGGAYTWFSSYDAGIVGKAEFMAHQTLYQKAINNTDGVATLSAIADGGWATDGSYKTKLVTMYQTLGTKYKWLDQKAIEQYGEKPYQTSQSSFSSDTKREPVTVETFSDCSDGSSGDAIDGTGTVPADATAWGYKPDNLPQSLKSYIIDPSQNGLVYGGSGWVENSGQCVDLTVSLGNRLWGHSGVVIGNGKDQANAWASIFGNRVKTTPKKGAIFSTQNGGGGYGHTGIVCHVFENGSILIVEQNTPLSGHDYFHQNNTWNYRIWTPAQQKAEITTFAYPDGKEAHIK